MKRNRYVDYIFGVVYDGTPKNLDYILGVFLSDRYSLYNGSAIVRRNDVAFLHVFSAERAKFDIVAEAVYLDRVLKGKAKNILTASYDIETLDVKMFDFATIEFEEYSFEDHDKFNENTVKEFYEKLHKHFPYNATLEFGTFMFERTFTTRLDDFYKNDKEYVDYTVTNMKGN